MLLDTDVWSLLFARHGSSTPQVTRWREQLTGLVPIISVQTLTEVLSGLYENDVGPRRRGEITGQLTRTHVHPIDFALAETHAAFKAELRRTGHALHAKIHTGDR